MIAPATIDTARRQSDVVAPPNNPPHPKAYRASLRSTRRPASERVAVQRTTPEVEIHGRERRMREKVP
jgi:hypothetical protein